MNAVLPAFNSFVLEEHSHGVDAFAQTDYMTGVSFVHPPVVVLPRVVAFFRDEWPAARVVFVFPQWTTQPWFRPLC